MFGYIRPCKGMLRICEYDVYKGVYCGLCRALGKEYGQLSRLLLSNDLTFLALLQLSLKEENPEAGFCRCFLHPFQKQSCFPASETLSFAAGASVLLGYYKLLDVISDKEPWYKKLTAHIFRLLLHFPYHKAKGLYPNTERICQTALAAQHQVETKCSGSLDAAAAPTAQGLSALLSENVPLLNQGQRRVLSRLGYLLGRYIYLCDAAADLQADAARQNYNPLLYLSPSTFLEEMSSEVMDADADINLHPAQNALYLTLGEVEKTFALLDIKRFDAILENILLLGLRQTADAILLQRSENQ